MGQGHEEAVAESDASEFQDETCDELESRRREFLAALQDDTAPVQPPLTDGNGVLLDEQIETPENDVPRGSSALLDKPAVAPAVPLNRQQRQARQRLLERKLRKAK